MPKKTTLRGQFLRTVLLMLACSLLVGLAVIVAVMIAFVKKVPDGEQFLMDSVSFLFGKEVLGPNGMIHVVVLAAIALCLLVVLMCVLLASRYTSRIAAALREFRRAADDLRSGELDFQILTYPERELDELAQALESVRQRLKATAAAEAAAQEERGLLMANLSHDLRTPITAIKGYVEGIQDGIAATPEKQYHFEYVDMLPFLQDLAEEYQDDVQQSGMTFQAELPKGSYTVTADRGKLKRVLDNLVSNAVKYGKPGGEIHFSAEEYEGGLVLQVTDNGKGISPQALHHVFDSFFRADAARTSSVPGSGLGLAICRSIVDSHHGKIWLTSEEGEGTRAFVYLPLQKEEGMA